jgi:ribosome-associated protein
MPRTSPKQPLSDKSLIKIILAAAAEKKAKDIKIIDISQRASVASHFIICTGESTPQLKALVEEMEKQLCAQHHKIYHQEGTPTSGWIILDIGSILVHIMLPKERAYYNLEGLWGEGGIIYHE